MGDGAAANIGSGAVGVGQMALTVGTTAALRVVSDGDPPHVPNGLWSYRVDAAHHLTGGATTEGGGVFEWLAQTFRLPDDPAEVNAVLERATPDGHGLTFLPLMAGERAPGWATHATGSLVGLRSSSTPTDIVQAALEGVALRLSLIADLLSDDDTTVFAGGGALAASPPWTQMIANALNRPLHLLSTGETTARGVAILAMRALGDCALTDYTPTANQIVEPVPTHVARLHAARARLQSLYDHMLASVDTP